MQKGGDCWESLGERCFFVGCLLKLFELSNRKAASFVHVANCWNRWKCFKMNENLKLGSGPYRQVESNRTGFMAKGSGTENWELLEALEPLKPLEPLASEESADSMDSWMASNEFNSQSSRKVFKTHYGVTYLKSIHTLNHRPCNGWQLHLWNAGSSLGEIAVVDL